MSDQTPDSGPTPCDRASLPAQAADLVQRLALAPHPEGGFYREVYRSAARVRPDDGRGERAALTTIDFLLARGQHSAWHRVASDEAWHLLEGGPLRLWCIAPTLDRLEVVTLEAGARRGHVVPAQAWQAAEPLGDYAWCAATVGPGFDFADFSFGRDQPALVGALARLEPALRRLL
jgi:hypothetical protein